MYTVCGKCFSQDLLERIGARLRAEPELSRRKLSREICQWMGWKNPQGKAQEMSCRKALAELNRRGVLKLPPVKRDYGFQRRGARPNEPLLEEKAVEFEGRLKDLGRITSEPVGSRGSAAAKLWTALMRRHHYLEEGPLCGAQLRYLVSSSTRGVIGALAFSSACWALKERDKHIGWTERARRKNLNRVVNNARFLIVPTVRVPNLASHVLSLTTARLAGDWENRYGVKPVLVETFVDGRRYMGTSYQAANWESVGDSAGRRDGVAKKIFVYPLSARWKQELCEEPPRRPLGRAPGVGQGEDWAERELGTAELYDPRLKERLYRITRDFYNRMQGNIPEACADKAATMAAYRFFANAKVSREVILTAHKEAAVERVREHKVVLAPQDTTILNYSAHPMTEDLGPINNKGDGQVGLVLHDTLAFTPEGTPLGILDAQFWARQETGKSRQRKSLPIEQKESMKWLRSFRAVEEVQRLCPDTMLVSMGDRESDIYELFREAAATPDGPKLLVRACKGRHRKVEQQKLWDFMAALPAAGVLEVHIPRRGNRKAREAKVEIRHARVALNPTKKYTSDGPIDLWAVYAVEAEAPEDVQAVEWMLLSTVEVNSFEHAQERVEWYSGRWGIEVYHRTLKSGCRIKDRQLGDARRLENCLAVDMVVAWRIYHLTMLGRETPEVPCTVFFKDVEWKALCCYKSKTSKLPKQPPTLSQAIRMVASMGGHLGRKGDGFPGTQTLWRGLQRLDTATEMYVILTGVISEHPSHSGP